MAQKNPVEKLLENQTELLKDMFIAELAIAGVPQLAIAKIVKVTASRVNPIAKAVNKRKKRNGGED